MKISVFGANGFLGRIMSQHFRGNGHEVWEYSHAPNSGQRGFAMEDETLQRLEIPQANDGSPSIALICSALSKIDECAANPIESTKLNVTGPLRLLRRLKAEGIIPVFFSSDMVFDGFSHEIYRESTPTNPINLYGLQKLTVEEEIRSLFDKHIVIRFSKAWSIHAEKSEGFVGQVVQALKSGKKMKCFTDQVSNPVCAEDIPLAIESAVKNQAWGTLHLAQDVAQTRFEGVIDICEVLRLDKSLIEPTLLQEARLPEARPLRVKLDNSRARSLGIKFRTFRDISVLGK